MRAALSVKHGAPLILRAYMHPMHAATRAIQKHLSTPESALCVELLCIQTATSFRACVSRLKVMLGRCETDAEVEAALAALTPTCRPSRATLTKLICMYSKAGHWQRGLAIFKHLRLLSLAPDSVLANAALWACRRGGNADEAWRIFGLMLKEGLDLDVVTYCALFPVLATVGDGQAAGLVRTLLRQSTLKGPIDSPAFPAGISRGVRYSNDLSGISREVIN